MYLAKTPSIVRPLTKDLTWRVNTDEPCLYLSFDDGPTSGITDKVLEILKSYHAKATFFCVGKNVSANRDLFLKLLEDGHSVGNHTYDHVNGWKTSNISYLKSFLQCSQEFESDLFRPPYGKINRAQSKAIISRAKIVMWDVLSGDFDLKSTPEKCLSRVIKNAKSGSIVVFHDSIKAKERMFYALEGTLSHFSKQGYTFKALDKSLL